MPKMSRHVHWPYVVSEVFELYVGLSAVIFIYFFGKFLVGRRRYEHPSRLEKLWRYAACFPIVAVGAVLMAKDAKGWNYNRGLIVLFALIIPALLGVADALRSRTTRR